MSTKYFTESEWAARYVKDPSFCPYCGEGHLTSQSNIEDHYDFATRIMRCDSCRKEWREVFELTAIEEID